MKNLLRLSTLLASSLVLLAAFSPMLTIVNPIMAPTMNLLNSINGTAYSTNWSGYAVTGASGSVTSAAGSWTVPTVTGTSSGQYAAFWVGIDGASSNTVEQTGVLAETTRSGSRGTTTTYYAWYEFYPSESIIQITKANSGAAATVKPSDLISASVTYVSVTTTFTLSITDQTEGWTFTISGSQSGATESSAEWIVEAPSSNFGVLPLANFGTVAFTGCAAKVGITTGPISSFTYEQINMVTNRGVVKDTTSSLSSNGESFSVTWKSSGSGGFFGF